jgi:hypothetical protein
MMMSDIALSLRVIYFTDVSCGFLLFYYHGEI